MSHWKIKVDENYVEVDVEESVSGHYKVKVNGKEFKVVVDEADWGISITPPGGVYATGQTAIMPHLQILEQKKEKPSRPTSIQRSPAPGETIVSATQQKTVMQPISPSPLIFSGKTLPSPMPGKVTKIMFQTGEKVKAGQPLCVIESMKMENTINSPRDGTISAVHIKIGDAVGAGSPLFDIE